jgi:hypothetical protein
LEYLDLFLARCEPLSDGFMATSEAACWRLGAVLLARRDSEVAVVRKAEVAGGSYEFAGLCALPGGMVRSARDLDVRTGLEASDIIQKSLRQRAWNEAGLLVRTATPLSTGPIVTSYSAKGRRRFTLVLGLEMVPEEGTALRSADGSIDSAFWMGPPVGWSAFAPANCLLLAHALWPEMTSKERDAAFSAVSSAHASCAKWASAADLPEPAQPWAADGLLSAWHGSWQAIP